MLWLPRSEPASNLAAAVTAVSLLCCRSNIAIEVLNCESRVSCQGRWRVAINQALNIKRPVTRRLMR